MPGLYLNKTNKKSLSAATEGYFVPVHLDRRTELLPTSNQKNTSKCVAMALAGWLEYNRWKNDGITKQIDPDPIYSRAKQIDEIVGEGTTLEAGLQAIQDLGLVSANQVNNIRSVSYPGDVKRAIHKYGVVLAAFDATSNWQFANKNGWIEPGGNSIGGHAVILCGYSDIDKIPYFSLQNSWGENQGWRGFNRISQELFVEQFSYGLVWDAK